MIGGMMAEENLAEFWINVQVLTTILTAWTLEFYSFLIVCKHILLKCT